MRDFDIYICLVSNQLVPNLLPSLLPGVNPPKASVLLTSPEMHPKGEHLKDMLQVRGWHPRLQNISPWNADDVRETFLDLLTEFEGERIALNVTGGNKIMALSAYGMIQEENNASAFYVDTENHQVIHLSPRIGSEKLDGVLDVNSALVAAGYMIRDAGKASVPAKLRQVGKMLVGRAEEWSGPLRILNACASRAEGCLYATVDYRHLQKPQLQELAEVLESAGVLQLDRNSGHMVFASEEDRGFACGGWLESHVQAVVNQLEAKGHVTDSAANMVVRSASGLENEIDMAFTAANRLHLIECKTGGFNEKGKADEVVYKLQALRDLIGGTYGQGMLVSYSKLREADRKRCREYNIRLVDGRNLLHLRTAILDWISEG